MAHISLCLQCYEEAIARQNGMRDDGHVAAFAMYELGTMLSQKPAVSYSPTLKILHYDMTVMLVAIIIITK